MSIANLQTHRLSLGVDEPLSVSELRILRGTHNVVPTDSYLQDYVAGREIVRRWIAISNFSSMTIDALRGEVRGHLFGSVCGQERIECQLLADQYIVEALNVGYLRLVRKRRSRR